MDIKALLADVQRETARIKQQQGRILRTFYETWGRDGLPFPSPEEAWLYYKSLHRLLDYAVPPLSLNDFRKQYLTQAIGTTPWET